jgi:hypothetical protein
MLLEIATVNRVPYLKDAEVVKERMADALHRAVDEPFPGIAWDFLKEIKISNRWLK